MSRSRRSRPWCSCRLSALFGPVRLDQWEQIIDSAIAAVDVGLCWWLMGRVGVRSLVDRFWLVALLGFSTQIWWVNTRGGVWHTGHLIAILLTLAALIEVFGRRRPWLLGLLVGAAFLTRAPVALRRAVLRLGDRRPGGGDAGATRDHGRGADGSPTRRQSCPPSLFSLWYNVARFGSPLESGYALASLPAFLELQRERGLFSLNHLATNLDYLFIHLPSFFVTQPDGRIQWLIPPRPDGLGMSILVTSPGLLLALRADWRSRMAIALGLTAVAVLVPEPALLRRWLAPVRLSLRARLDPVRHGPRGTWQWLVAASRPGARSSSCSASPSTWWACIGPTTSDERESSGGRVAMTSVRLADRGGRDLEGDRGR